jgi:hypothetical protein
VAAKNKYGNVPHCVALEGLADFAWLPEILGNLFPSIAEVKEEWRCTCTPPICLYGMDKVTLPLLVKRIILLYFLRKTRHI